MGLVEGISFIVAGNYKEYLGCTIAESNFGVLRSLWVDWTTFVLDMGLDFDRG